ncbi:MAG: glycosyltransferase [Ilumatobacter sp.]
MAVDASIVVVTHRGVGDLVWACLASLSHASCQLEAPTTAVYVVDNSADPIVGAPAYGPDVESVLRVDNNGFGAAANAGIRLAREASEGPVVVLNDDIEVQSGWLAPLLAELDVARRVGAVQPVLLQHGTDRVNSLGVRLDRHGAGSDVGLDAAAESLDRSGALAIDLFTGGAVLFAPSFIDATRGFDERYFLYYEDVDLALRGRELGWSYRCALGSTVGHHGGATTSGLGSDIIAHQERNRLMTVVRFAPRATIARAVWLSIRRLRHAPRSIHAAALVGGLRAAPGALWRRHAARRGGRADIVWPDGG